MSKLSSKYVDSESPSTEYVLFIMHYFGATICCTGMTSIVGCNRLPGK